MEFQMQSQPSIITPWTTPEEFIITYQSLFGKNAQEVDQFRGYQTLDYWVTRRSNQCPAQVRATKILLDALMQDDSKKSEEYLQSNYGLSIIQFFNFCSSTVQSHNMRTMYECAKALNIKPSIVDIRHACSHSTTMPTLNVLRKTTHYCLSWLEKNFWDVVKEELNQNPYPSEPLDGRELNILQLYDIGLEAHFRNAQNVKQAARCLDPGRFRELKNYSEAFQESSILRILSILMNKLEHVNSNSAEFIYNVQINFCSMKSFFGINFDNPIDKKRILLGLLPLFKSFAKMAILDEVLLKIIEIANNECNTKRMREAFTGLGILIANGAIHLRNLKAEYHLQAMRNSNISDLDFRDLNRMDIPRIAKKLFQSMGIDFEGILVIGDPITGPKEVLVSNSMMLEAIKDMNEISAPLLESVIPLVCDPYTRTPIMENERQTLVNLIRSKLVPRMCEDYNLYSMKTVEDFLECVPQPQKRARLE